MSIQWRWTRRAINIPWQDRSRGEGRGDGEGERKEKRTSKRERKGGRKWVRGWAQWTDSFARLLLSFSLYVSTSVALHRTTRPLLCSVIYSQSRADTRCWRLLHHIATLRHNHSLPICDCSLWVGLFITYRSGLKVKCISLLCECLYECSVCVILIQNCEKSWEGPLPTSSIIGPKASLSITLWPVDETSAFCTSSSFAAAAFSVNKRVSHKKLRGKIKKTWKHH